MSVTPPEYGGCLWPIAPECKTDQWDDLDEPVQELGLAYASATLERLTLGRVGVCPITIRPCRQRPSAAAYAAASGPGFSPLNWNGVWTNVCGCDGGCTCASNCEIQLPPPVGRIDEVLVDGDVVDPGDYELQSGHILVWTGGGDCPWNLEQDMATALTEPGTFAITYLNAYPVDLLGANAVTILALEFAKACASKTCQLPPNVTTLVRAGVSMQIAAGTFPGGKTGIREVDAYIALWNPKGHTSPGFVYSPDLPTHRVVG
jgi:hypothetical protein